MYVLKNTQNLQFMYDICITCAYYEKGLWVKRISVQCIPQPQYHYPFPLQHTARHPPPQVSHHPAINSAQTLPKWDYSFCLHCTVTHFARFLHFEMERNKKNNEGKKKFAVITIPVLQVAGFALFFKKRRRKKGNSELELSNCQRIDINASWWRHLSSWVNALMMVWKHVVWLT